MIKNKNTRPMLIVLLLIAAVLVGNFLIMGEYINEGGPAGTGDVPISDIADVYVSAITLSHVGPIETGDTVVAEGFNEVIILTTDFDSGREPPVNMEVRLVLDTGFVVDTQTIENMEIGGQSYIASYGLGGVPQGTYGAVFVYDGYWSDGVGTINYLYGESLRFFLQNTKVAQPHPATNVRITSDLTVEPFTLTTLEWEWAYNGQAALIVTNEDDKVLFDETVVGVSEPTLFTYDYDAEYSGTHFITMTVRPADGSTNIPNSDTIQVHVNLGGKQEEFPPTVTSAHLTVYTMLANGERTGIEYHLFATAPVWTHSEVSTDGVYIIELTVTPTNSLDRVTVEIDGGVEEYEMTQVAGVWSVSINTDTMEEGIHTFTVIGVDTTNQYSYDMGSVTIPVRVDSADPLVYLVIAIVAIFIVLFVVLRRR